MNRGRFIIRNHRIRLVPLLILVAGGLGSGAQALTPEEENTISAYDTVMPSVVTILVDAGRVPGGPGPFPGSDFSLGSGFVIEPGLVVTNFHVLENARMISVVRHDGRQEIATVVGTAPGLDLAVLGVPFSAEELPPAPVASVAAVRVGQKVLTVSSPLGLHHSVTVGVVSSLRRELPGLDLGPNLILFDAALNRGQSGGPLVDSQGRVIGVTTATIEQAEAIGFAIPIDVVLNVLPDLKSMGHPFRPQLGITGTSVTPALAALFNLPVGYGVLIEKTEAGGPARQAGLRGGTRAVNLGDLEYVVGGEIITAMNDSPIRNTGDLLRRLLALDPGDRLEFTVRDGARERRVALEVPEMAH